jgi:hypothetical protein
MSAIQQPRTRERLRIEANPFVSGNLHIGRSLQTALDQVIAQVVLKTPVVLVSGNPGAGKSLLAEMTARACSAMELSVQSVVRGDMVHMALDQRSDLLLVDEADSVADTFLEVLRAEVGKTVATTTVFLGLPACINRFVSLGVQPVVVELRLFSPADARTYLLDAAADFPDLFTADALDLIVHEAHGTPRLLRSMASFAFFVAASDSASQIRVRHVGQARAAQVPSAAPDLSKKRIERMFCDSQTAIENYKNGRSPSLAQPGGDESTKGHACHVDTPLKGRSDVYLSSGADGVVKSLEPLPWNNETSVKDQKSAHFLLDAENADDGTPRELHHDESRVEDQEQLRCKSREDSSDDPRLSSGTLLAITAFVTMVSLTSVQVLPSILTRPSPNSTPKPSAPVQTLPAELWGFIAPTPMFVPALPPPGAVETFGKATPVSNEIEKVADAEEMEKVADAEKGGTDLSGAADLLVRSAKGGMNRSALTEEEKAAVVRGIRELEKDAAQGKRQ